MSSSTTATGSGRSTSRSGGSGTRRPCPRNGSSSAGMDQATAAPGVLDAIRTADVVLLPPSNPSSRSASSSASRACETRCAAPGHRWSASRRSSAGRAGPRPRRRLPARPSGWSRPRSRRGSLRGLPRRLAGLGRGRGSVRLPRAAVRGPSAAHDRRRRCRRHRRRRTRPGAASCKAVPDVTAVSIIPLTGMPEVGRRRRPRRAGRRRRRPGRAASRRGRRARRLEQDRVQIAWPVGRFGRQDARRSPARRSGSSPSGTGRRPGHPRRPVDRGPDHGRGRRRRVQHRRPRRRAAAARRPRRRGRAPAGGAPRGGTGLRRIGVVLSDTAGRPWRFGQIDFALGAAGIAVVDDLRGASTPTGEPWPSRRGRWLTSSRPRPTSSRARPTRSRPPSSAARWALDERGPGARALDPGRAAVTGSPRTQRGGAGGPGHRAGQPGRHRRRHRHRRRRGRRHPAASGRRGRPARRARCRCGRRGRRGQRQRARRHTSWGRR